jgi:hypothetical protein
VVRQDLAEGLTAHIQATLQQAATVLSAVTQHSVMVCINILRMEEPGERKEESRILLRERHPKLMMARAVLDLLRASSPPLLVRPISSQQTQTQRLMEILEQEILQILAALVERLYNFLELQPVSLLTT